MYEWREPSAVGTYLLLMGLVHNPHQSGSVLHDLGRVLIRMAWLYQSLPLNASVLMSRMLHFEVDGASNNTCHRIRLRPNVKQMLTYFLLFLEYKFNGANNIDLNLIASCILRQPRSLTSTTSLTSASTY